MRLQSKLQHVAHVLQVPVQLGRGGGERSRAPGRESHHEARETASLGLGLPAHWQVFDGILHRGLEELGFVFACQVQSQNGSPFETRKRSVRIHERKKLPGADLAPLKREQLISCQSGRQQQFVDPVLAERHKDINMAHVAVLKPANVQGHASNVSLLGHVDRYDLCRRKLREQQCSRVVVLLGWKVIDILGIAAVLCFEMGQPGLELPPGRILLERVGLEQGHCARKPELLHGSLEFEGGAVEVGRVRRVSVAKDAKGSMAGLYLGESPALLQHRLSVGRHVATAGGAGNDEDEVSSRYGARLEVVERGGWSN
ncbi:hypothetical protein G6O67_004356 [Ophiocordyceps sinensis]|uniref:Uncharacterized protein n=1 Tax=Ophiocordyceps sinensis TaxID=72228 RepID=A0A8H4PNM0_9HYPO|nr:hypothetical protein G6O67_004356 [Ophiocordyceps sinensis]